MNRRLISASLLAALTFCGGAFAQQFTDVSVEAGLNRDFTRSWGNPLWGDLNNDGKLDLLVSNHESPSGVSEGGVYPNIYLNNGDGTFTDVQPTSGVIEQPLDTGAWQGISIADYDADGNLDMFIAQPPFQGGGNAPVRNPLFKGNGDGTWTYVSDQVGLLNDREYTECSFFVDYDNDGDLDIFVKNIPDTVTTNMMYQNNGDGTFTPTTDIGDLATANNGVTEGSIVAFADYDNDGWMDVVIGGNGSSENLYHNNRDGTFSDVTAAAGFIPKANTQGLAWGDYDNDGLIDLYVSRGKATGGGVLSNDLYHNNGDGTFTDVANQAHVDDNTNTWAAVWGDYDNDGLLDLFVARPGTSEIGTGNANLLYHSNGDGTFTDVAVQEGVAQEDNEITSAHKLAAWGDYDEDGYLDLATKDGISPGLITGDAFKGQQFLFKNSGGTNHYIKLSLKGVESNLQGLAARITVIHDGQIAYRQNDGGGGGAWGSQSAEPMHFGIGTSETATIRIAWPSGLVDILPEVAADTTMTVTEGSYPPSPQSQNLSTRLQVQTADGVGIGGFIISGTGTKTVLIRGLGPSLAGSGVADFLADPVLELHKPTGPVLVNDNWRDSQEAEIRATSLPPTDDAEAAMVVNLTAGAAYTAILSGSNGTTGIGLIEIYDLDAGIDSQLANVSTRGFVGTDDDVMIGGVIVGPNGASDATVVVRAIGPSLSGQVANPLADPNLELRDANGSLVAFNNDWQDDPDQAAALEAAEIAPTDPLESAIYATLGTGPYTAVVHGQDATTGVGLVEIYNLLQTTTAPAKISR